MMMKSSPQAARMPSHNFLGKTVAVFQTAAVFVIALVGAFGNELIDQIAFAAHDFYAIVSCLLRQLCAAYVVLYGLFELRSDSVHEVWRD